jgi:ribosome-binding protein aMBF1 (putative translation factor)
MELIMGFYFVDPETYRKYRDEVIELSHAVQINAQEHLPVEKRQSGLSDAQIAERLGIEEQVVREIRCVAERDEYPIDEFEAAIRFKDKACRDYAASGMSSVMKKYVDRAKKP